MVQLSKRKMKPGVQVHMFKLLFDVIGTRENNSVFKSVIRGVFSSTEQLMIAKRVSILFLLVKGVDWSMICTILKVSPSSVSKCHMILINSKVVSDILKKRAARKDMNIFFDELFLSFFGPGTAFINWRDAWKRKKDLEQRQNEIL